MKRRHLLRSSAFAGTWSLIPPFAKAQGANDKLRVVVIGLKGRGGYHLGSVVSHPKTKLMGICDIDTDQLDRRLKEHPGIKTYTDYRKVCEDPEVDAITIATCNHTHALIALTAAANGKHVFLEKPVSHNIWEGQKLIEGQKKYGVVMAHGFQRRSEKAWAEAFAWIKEGHLGKLKVARGFCYKPRKSIGKVAAPVKPSKTVDYDLWSGPREMLPIRRKQFHYDWHWQSPYGNGDLGNQGVHQLDVCRWALGDPMKLPDHYYWCGGRFGYDDDGDTPNTALASAVYGEGQLIFEVRGLPKKDLDWKHGMDNFEGTSIGNIIEYEGGKLIGGHSAACRILDSEGKVLKEFQSRDNHVHSWIDASLSGKQNDMHDMANGHYSSAIAHIHTALLKANSILWTAGMGAENSPLGDAFARMKKHLAANQITKGIPSNYFEADLKKHLEMFTSKPNGNYRKDFELPNA